MIKVEISLGEALDRLSILQIKAGRIKDEGKRQKASDQCENLRQRVAGVPDPDWKIRNLYNELVRVNGRLWDLENKVRAASPLHRQSTDDQLTLLELYRTISKLNDERAEVKRHVDEEIGDDSGEVKEHDTSD